MVLLLNVFLCIDLVFSSTCLDQLTADLKILAAIFDVRAISYAWLKWYFFVRFDKRFILTNGDSTQVLNYNRYRFSYSCISSYFRP